MLVKEFNKLGDTSFRVKHQIAGYTQILILLINTLEKNKDLTKDEFDNIFKNFCSVEHIYSYANDKKISNRVNFVLTLFKKLKVIGIKNNKLQIINNEKINLFKKILDQKSSIGLENWFFDLLYNNIQEFKDMINFCNTHHNPIKYSKLLLTWMLYDKHNDNFENLYLKIVQNEEEVFEENINLYLNLPQNKNKNPEIILNNSYRKKSGTKLPVLTKLISNKINDSVLSNELIYKLIKIDELKSLYINGNKRVLEHVKFEKIKNFINNNSAKEILKLVLKNKLKLNLEKEYFDLNRRWLNDLNLINGEYININNIKKYLKQDIVIFDNETNYPFDINQVKEYLDHIQNSDFSFKVNNDEIKNVPNSTLAEYFVNLYYCLLKKYSPNDFKIRSRTLLVPGTLLPYMHAPGSGPDMYDIVNNELITIETTIHASKNSVKNNEVFPVLSHVENKNLSYIKIQTEKKFSKKTIILVTILNPSTFSDIKHKIKHNYSEPDNLVVQIINFTNINKAI